MEESDIDEWFSEEKERLEERFYAALNASKSTEKAKDNAKKRFDKDYRALIATLQKKQLDLYERKRRVAAIHAPIDKAMARMRLASMRVTQWSAAKKEAVKKWFFDKKVRRILRDKSDL
jgi:hypothetical protein